MTRDSCHNVLSIIVSVDFFPQDGPNEVDGCRYERFIVYDLHLVWIHF